MATIHYPGVPGTIIYGGRASVAPGAELTTLTLVNESATAQAAGFVSPMFGVPLKQGDVPAGSYPAFTLADNTPCPATLWGVTSWPDGSMKFCGAMIRVPASVPGSGTLAIKVKSGGVAPGSSARSTADLTAADLKAELTGVTNLTGLWTASLNTAITDATDIVLIGDGAAGKVWRIGGHVKQAGAAHGQLYCWHYVAALQNGSDGLQGLRYLGRIAQPFADVASPAPSRRVLTAALKSGATTLRSLQGHDTTETPGANIGMPHFSSFFTAGTNGRWDYVQGGGSQAADCTIRVTHDKTYFIKSRLLPPYDTTLAVTAGLGYDYVPYTAGPMQRHMPGTGGREDIGLLPSWHVRHVLSPIAAHDKTMRCVGLATGGWRNLLRRTAYPNGQIPCTTAAASYAGMGAVQSSWRYYGAGNGFTVPVPNDSLWYEEADSSHRPGAVYYPYIATGEPQYLDMLCDNANAWILNLVPGGKSMNTTLPINMGTVKLTGAFGERDVTVAGTTYIGGGLFFYENMTRVTAWGTRDVAQAAALLPDTCPAGTENRVYLREVMSKCHTAINAYNSALGVPWSNSGIMFFDSANYDDSPWCSGFVSESVCHQASILGTTEAATLRAYLAKYWENIAQRMDISCAFAYRCNIYDDTGRRSDSVNSLVYKVGVNLAFSAATSRTTISNGPEGTNGQWMPTNGDIFAFNDVYDPVRPYPSQPQYKRLHAVNCSGQTFQLSETPGGAPLAVPADCVVSCCGAQIQNFSPNITFEGYIGTGVYLSSITNAIRHHAAVGDAVPTAVSESSARLASSGTTFEQDPRNAVLTAYPA
ncbi:MAG: hypothetical protein JSS23_03020 [Proteobacteria bacterium]|nr:hypothetical protein [Pseudomonadota bacterium]